MQWQSKLCYYDVRLFDKLKREWIMRQNATNMLESEDFVVGCRHDGNQDYLAATKNASKPNA